MAVTVTSQTSTPGNARASDGAIEVVETFVLSNGRTIRSGYLADKATDQAAHLAAAATQLLADLSSNEVSDNISAVLSLGSLATPAFVYSIVADNVVALRAAYAVATQLQAVMIGDFLSTLTNLQLQNAFGLTAGQVTTLRTNKLTPAATIAANIRAAAGQ